MRKKFLNEMPEVLRRRWAEVTDLPVLEVEPEPRKRPIFVCVIRAPETVKMISEVLELELNPELPFLELHIDSDGELLMTCHTNLNTDDWVQTKLNARRA